MWASKSRVSAAIDRFFYLQGTKGSRLWDQVGSMSAEQMDVQKGHEGMETLGGVMAWGSVLHLPSAHRRDMGKREREGKGKGKEKKWKAKGHTRWLGGHGWQRMLVLYCLYGVHFERVQYPVLLYSSPRVRYLT